jgi:broad specificity phosphatase PhoE
MSPCELILIRHADAASDSRLCGWFDPPLTGLGERQARRLRRRLDAETIDAIYTSPLRRALLTSEAAHGARRVEPDLREIHCGLLDGAPLRVVQTRHAALWRRNLAQDDDNFRWPGGESYAGFRRRALEVLRRIAVEGAGGRVLVFTHAGVISQFLGYLTGVPAARWEPLRPANASVTRVLWDGGRGEILSFNESAAMEGVEWGELERVG